MMRVKWGKFIRKNFRKSFRGSLQSNTLLELPPLSFLSSPPPPPPFFFFYLILDHSKSPAVMNWLITVIWPVQVLCKANQ